jgi:translocator protein
MRALVGWLAAAFVPAIAGAAFPAPAYYRGLSKPSWAPPPWLFGPVWTVLYAMIGVSAWLVSRRGTGRGAIAAWWAQLALNAAWTPIFFGLRAPGVALAEIAAMWAAIVATVVAFGRRSPLAAALLIPYLGWVSFAAVLNLEIWRRNH